LVLFSKKEALPFEKRSKNFFPSGYGADVRAYSADDVVEIFRGMRRSCW
jgi:hypothetical protein